MREVSKRLLALLAVVILLLPSSICAFATNDTISSSEKAMRVREAVELRTENSETFLLSDGTYQCVVYAEDKYYKDDSNTLSLIDNTIIADTASPGHYRNTANDFDVSFSDNGTPKVSIEKGGVSINFIPSNAYSIARANKQISPRSSQIAVGKIENCKPLNALTATGNNTVMYSDVFTDTDLVYVVKNTALKEYIVLGSNAAPNQFSFMYKMNGLSLQTIDGTPCFTDKEGAIVFSLGKLFAVDANGVYTDNVTYSYTVDDKETAVITVILDEDYLTSAERVFPVIVDPTISTVDSSSETFVASNFSSTNWDIAEFMAIGKSSFYGTCRSYLSFSLPSSLMGCDIITASLEVAKDGGSPTYLKTYRCTGSWSAKTLTWENKPGYTTTNASGIAIPQSDGVWYTMFVTSIVQSWLHGTYSNNGFVLASTNETSTNYFSSFCTTEMDSTYSPRLCITYNVDAWLLALDSVEYDAYGNRVYFSAYFDEIKNFVVNYRQGYTNTSNFTSMSTATMISRMQTPNILFIATHGSKTTLRRSTSGDVLSMSDLTGVDLSNLDFVMLYACSCAKGGIDGTVDNMAEKLIQCGAKTVIAFTEDISMTEFDVFSAQLVEQALEGKTVQQSLDEINWHAFQIDIYNYAVIAGNGNIVLTDI